MKVYSYSEARQKFTEVLNRATREGAVEIRRRDRSEERRVGKECRL